MTNMLEQFGDITGDSSRYDSPFDLLLGASNQDEHVFIKALEDVQPKHVINLTNNLSLIGQDGDPQFIIAQNVLALSTLLSFAFVAVQDNNPAFPEDEAAFFYDAARWLCLNGYRNINATRNLRDLKENFERSCKQYMPAMWPKITHGLVLHQNYDRYSLPAYDPGRISSRIDSLKPNLKGKNICLISCANGGTPIGADLFNRLQGTVGEFSAWYPIRYSRRKSQDVRPILPRRTEEILGNAKGPWDMVMVVDEDMSSGRTLQEMSDWAETLLGVPAYPMAIIDESCSAHRSGEELRLRQEAALLYLGFR